MLLADEELDVPDGTRYSGWEDESLSYVNDELELVGTRELASEKLALLGGSLYEGLEAELLPYVDDELEFAEGGVVADEELALLGGAVYSGGEVVGLPYVNELKVDEGRGPAGKELEDLSLTVVELGAVP